MKPDLFQTQVRPNGDNGHANVQLHFGSRPGPVLLQASGESDSTPHQFRPRSESITDQVRSRPCHAQIPGSLRIQRSPTQILPTARSFAARARSDATLIRAQIQFRFNAAPTQTRRRPNLGSIQKRFSPAPLTFSPDSTQIPKRAKPDPIQAQFRYNSGAIQIQFRYSPNSAQLQSRFISDAIPTQC